MSLTETSVTLVSPWKQNQINLHEIKSSANERGWSKKHKKKHVSKKNVKKHFVQFEQPPTSSADVLK